jgi:GR25 family glycosyltransferase involved in LPS biosynthesis
MILRVYVIHTKTLGMRKGMCEDLCRKLEASPHFQVKFQYIHQFDADDVAKLNPTTMINVEPIAEEGYEELNKLLKPLSTPAMSNALKHFAAMKIIAQQAGDQDINLVIEDDVCFSDQIADQIQRCIEAMRQEQTPWDVVYVGFPPAQAPQSAGFTFQSVHSLYKVLPGCDSYIITKAASQRIVEAHMPVKFVENIHLTYLGQKLKLNTGMSVPNIFVEGSKLGAYVSTLNVNNLLIYNPHYREMFQVVHNKSQYDDAERRVIEEAWKATPYKFHPDFLYLYGMYLLKDQQFQQARAQFEKAFELYKKNDCQMSKDSVFLNNYIELCKVLQD